MKRFLHRVYYVCSITLGSPSFFELDCVERDARRRCACWRLGDWEIRRVGERVMGKKGDGENWRLGDKVKE